MTLVATTLETALHRPAHNLGAVAVSDGLRASFVLGLQRVLPGARFSLASAVLRSLRMRKDDDEVELLRLAAQAADRVVASMAAGPARRPHRGRRRARGPRPAGGRGPRARRVLDRRLRAQQRVAAPSARRPRDPGRRADRDRHRRHDRRVRQRHHAHGLGDRRRPGARPGRGVPAPVRACSRTPRPRRPAPCARASPCEQVDAVAREHHRRRRVRPAVHPPDGPRDRPRGATRSRTSSPATRSRWRRASRSAWSPASTSRAGTGRGSRTSSSAARRARSCSTSRPGTCWSSPAEPEPGLARPATGDGGARAGYHPPIGRTPGRTESPT